VKRARASTVLSRTAHPDSGHNWWVW